MRMNEAPRPDAHVPDPCASNPNVRASTGGARAPGIRDVSRVRGHGPGLRLRLQNVPTRRAVQGENRWNFVSRVSVLVVQSVALVMCDLGTRSTCVEQLHVFMCPRFTYRTVDFRPAM